MPKRLDAINFTKRAIEALEPPETGRRYVYDTKQPNLAVCVTSAGTKTFYRTGRGVDGRPVRIKIGRFPDLHPDTARTRARAIAGDIAKGVDPTRQKRKKGATLADLADHWLAHAKQHKRTWQEDQRKLNAYFGSLKNNRLEDVDVATVAKWHRRLGEKHGHYLANRARALLSAMFAKASEIGYQGPNPVTPVKRFREESRERYLLASEIGPFFQAVKAEPEPWCDFWLLCLFSGARRGNVASMAWRDIDLDAGLWRVPGEQSKSGLPIVVVLPPPAVAILQARREQANGSKYVFPADSTTGHVHDPRKSWARVLKTSGIEDLRPHDLRRTLGSWQANLGASLQVIGASLGHVDVKSTAVYSRLQVNPVRTSVTGAVTAMLEHVKEDEGSQR